MNYNRNDITVAVTKEGKLIVAQGKAKHERLRARDDIADMEAGLYYSQIPYRCVVRANGNDWRIMTPTAARARGYEIVRMLGHGDVS